MREKKIHWNQKVTYFGLPKCGGSVSKESTCNAGDLGLILGFGGSPGGGTGTHSSILAWRNPWAEKPGELQFMGSQRVGHN